MQSFLDQPGKFMEICCSKFHFWDDSGEENIREIWVKLKDVPLFLWHLNFFKEFTSRWGKFIKLADVSMERSTLIAAWVSLISYGTWRKNKFSIKISVDDGFIDDRIKKDFGYRGSSGDEVNLNDNGSCSGERTLGSTPEALENDDFINGTTTIAETLVNEVVINEVSEEVVLGMVSRGEVVDSINNKMNVALEEELMCGGGFIANVSEVS
ncbi:hypothetical protein COLO4_25279 [Corchorus olitorius]|uniref:DUF4283 domain-containing protein n=1 Tax=Corchorus olitorius TaxID=93759 RepID=A0A1R3I3R4_9ROSI|nr:hypothetical protein COLO4_25279 [Corchorus olitorius]